MCHLSGQTKLETVSSNVQKQVQLPSLLKQTLWSDIFIYLFSSELLIGKVVPVRN
jgi:hypothetical protein